MFPNPTCEISNYVIEPDDGLYNLYLSPEMQETSGIKRCLAAAATIAELVDYLLHKQGDLHDTDILIEFIDNNVFQLQYFIACNNSDPVFVLFENINNTRNPIDNDKCYSPLNNWKQILQIQSTKFVEEWKEGNSLLNRN